jgi:alkaline phosphatase D
VAFWPEGRKDQVKEPLEDPTVLDKPGLKLIGDRQWEFLRSWQRDWRGADMKVLLSQTLFCGIPTHHGGDKMFLYGDLDSGGWPQTPRNKIVDFLRRCCAFHICGDQHVPFLVQYGVENFQDAGWAHCTPAITVGYQRRFHPDPLGWPVMNRPSHNLANTGSYMDGFGNKNYVFAVGNPEDDTRSDLRYMRAQLSSSGYSIITFNQENREIKVDAYRFLADVSDPGLEDNQFPGWPLTISQYDCAGLDSGYALPTLELEGLENVIVEVIREDTGEIESIVRMNGSEFIPKVYKPGTFTIRVGDPEKDLWKEITGIELARKSKNPIILLKF